MTTLNLRLVLFASVVFISATGVHGQPSQDRMTHAYPLDGECGASIPNVFPLACFRFAPLKQDMLVHVEVRDATGLAAAAIVEFWDESEEIYARSTICGSGVVFAPEGADFAWIVAAGGPFSMPRVDCPLASGVWTTGDVTIEFIGPA